MKVCEKVQRKGTTSYNEVADELVAEFSAADSHILPSESVSAPGRPPCRLPRVQRRPRNPWEGRFLTHWCREAVASLWHLLAPVGPCGGRPGSGVACGLGGVQGPVLMCCSARGPGPSGTPRVSARPTIRRTSGGVCTTR